MAVSSNLVWSGPKHGAQIVKAMRLEETPRLDPRRHRQGSDSWLTNEITSSDDFVFERDGRVFQKA
jgi:hypothetical protein